jgi:hypothetical protein
MGFYVQGRHYVAIEIKYHRSCYATYTRETYRTHSVEVSADDQPSAEL